MKRWIPFITIFGIAGVSAIYFLIFFHASDYIPNTDDVSIIFREACAECHGIRGEVTGIIYPSLNDLSINERKIRNVIRYGAFLMPAFPNINDSTLVRLSQYIAEKSFRDSVAVKSED